jgi:hypothetical protein
MSKMKDLYTDIQEMLMDEMPVERIVESTGVPLAVVLEIKYDMIAESVAYVADNDYFD